MFCAIADNHIEERNHTRKNQLYYGAIRACGFLPTSTPLHQFASAKGVVLLLVHQIEGYEMTKIKRASATVNVLFFYLRPRGSDKEMRNQEHFKKTAPANVLPYLAQSYVSKTTISVFHH